VFIHVYTLYTCRRAPCVESVADGTETHAVIANNIQASPKDIPVQLSTLLPLTIECAIGLIVGGALQMLLLLLLLPFIHDAQK